MKKLHIVMASLSSRLYGDGARLLSAILKKRGHSVRMVFLVDQEMEHYTEDVQEQFIELCAGADLVCLSFMSDGFRRAAHLTRAVRERLTLPIVWGGHHATCAPEECMEHVDILCRGEGEEALPELVARLAEGKPLHPVRNLWVRRKGRIIRNEMRPLITDLDANPWPDYAMNDHFIRDDDDRIKPMSLDLMMKFHIQHPLSFPLYALCSSRGCARACSYCYNGYFNKLFPGQPRVRTRSVKSVVLEIREMLDTYPFMRTFSFLDDDFLLRSREELEEFAHLIREKLPDVLARSFWAVATTPTSLTREKLDILVPAGLRTITLGMQTGSERMSSGVYNRHLKNETFLRKAEILDRHFNRQVIIMVDFMINCPYETEEDHIQTIELIRKMPSWFLMNFYRFVFFPGTPIHERALAEGVIHSGPEVYCNKKFWPFRYQGYPFIIHALFLVAVINFRLPDWIKRFLISRAGRAMGRLIPQKLLDTIPWNRLFFKLWAWNHQSIFRGREIKHH